MPAASSAHPDPHLGADLDVVADLVAEAGALLLASQSEVAVVGQKTGTEFVTELDRQAEDLLVAGLRRRFPDDTILAEEGGGRENDRGRTWYIDPLDGTTNYAHGHPFFSVSVACADPQRLLLGVVFAPYLDEMYLATAGGGAQLRRPAHGLEQLLPQRRPVDLEQALLATGFPYVRDERVARNTDLVRRFLEARCHGVRRGGSAAIDLVHVAAGKLDGYWEMGLRPWDTAAGTLIARETGTVVSGFEGNPGRLHHLNIVAAVPGLYDRMRAVINGTP